MKQIFRLLLLLLLLLFPLHLLNNKVISLPPMGKLLNPFHGFITSNQIHKIKIQLPNLKDSVNVTWDSNNIPHIFANNESDMYMVQGYIVASDRLWQMDFVSRLHSGRLSEIMGYNQHILENDRFMRRLGILNGAKASLSTIASCSKDQENYKNWDGIADCPEGFQKNIKQPDVYNMLTSYSIGVNSYIDDLNWDELPIEYKILDYEPERWNPLKTCILLKAMSLDLSGRNTDLLYTEIVQKYGVEDADFLYPEIPYNNDPIIDEKNKISKPSISPSTEDCSEELEFSGNIVFPTQISDMYNPGIGSNNWAVHKNSTKNNNAILANDPHLGLNLPNIWYVMQVSSLDENNKALDVMGATIPGAPGVLSGFNNYIAWGETNGEDDVSDFYEIEVDPNKSNHYMYDGKSFPFIIKEEEIYIRGNALEFPRTFIDTIKLTSHHGPIIIDSSNESMAIFNRGISAVYSDVNFAFRWIAHDPTQEIKAFYDMNHATNYNQFKEALKSYKCPSQNFVYADIVGNVAMHHNGKIPIRCERYKKNILPGNSSDFIWKGFIPFDELPSIKNPARGYVSSANQHPIPDGVEYYYLPGVYWPSHRAHRINQMLDYRVENKDIDVEYMKEIQNDNFNNYAFDILPHLLPIIKNKLQEKFKLYNEKLDSLNIKRQECYNRNNMNDGNDEVVRFIICNPSNPYSSNYSNSDQKIYDDIENYENMAKIYYELLDWQKAPVHNANMYQPIIFDAWYKELSESVWGDLFLDEENNQKYNNHVYPLYDRLLKIMEHHPSKQSKWFDDIRTKDEETVEDIVWRSYNSAINKLRIQNTGEYKDWKYSDYRGTDIHHMIPGKQFDAFSRLDVPTSGSRWSPNAMQKHFGPSWRYIVEMEDGNVRALGVYPGGQSGDPSSEYYDNYIDRWNDGKYLDLNFTYFNNQSNLDGKKVVFSNE